MVGFSIYSPYVHVARRLTKIVKENSFASVMWGGIHPTKDECRKEVEIQIKKEY